MHGLIDNLKGLGRTRLLILGGVGVAILAFILFFATSLTRPSLSPLYSGLDPAEAAQVLRVVEQLAVPYEMTADGMTLSVPRSEFARVRMALAEQGLPSKGGLGYEIFDENGTLGMTSFMQKVNRLRALEGELARTIQSIQGVHAARVHLVLPEREAFSREAPDPSASVVIRTNAGFALERSQALAIRHVVSASVPNLRPGAVTVMDTTGRLLLSEEGSPAESVTSDNLRTAIEDRMARNLENLLSARVGAGNVRVQVAAELDLARQTTRSQRFNPDEQVVRSSQLIEEQSQEESSEPNVSVQQNLPMAGLEESTSGTQAARNRTEETFNYEISNVLVESEVQPGQIKRLSVAVLINGRYVEEEGSLVYQDRSPEELERIGNLVRSAVGFDEARGDSVTVDSMEFVDYAFDLGAPAGSAFKTILAENMVDIIRWLIALAALALVVFALRPLVARLLPEPKSAAATAGAAASAPSMSVPEDEAAERAEAAEDEPTVAIDQVSGNVQASKINRLSEIIEDNQEQAVKVIKAWLAKE